MGKRLIIKGADFSENGINENEVDITNIVFSEVIQGRRDTDASIDTTNMTRVTSSILSLSSIGAKAGDKIVINNDNIPGLLFGFAQGVSETDFTGSESHWYTSNKGEYSSITLKGDTYVITDYAYLFSTIGNGKNSTAG